MALWETQSAQQGASAPSSFPRRTSHCQSRSDQKWCWVLNKWSIKYSVSVSACWWSSCSSDGWWWMLRWMPPPQPRQHPCFSNMWLLFCTQRKELGVVWANEKREREQNGNEWWVCRSVCVYVCVCFCMSKHIFVHRRFDVYIWCRGHSARLVQNIMHKNSHVKGSRGRTGCSSRTSAAINPQPAYN